MQVCLPCSRHTLGPSVFFTTSGTGTLPGHAGGTTTAACVFTARLLLLLRFFLAALRHTSPVRNVVEACMLGRACYAVFLSS